MPNKNNLTGWRKVGVFGIAIVAIVTLAFLGLPVEQAAKWIALTATGFFAGNGLEHLGKLIKVK